MMSLSDVEKDEFKPINLTSLDSFNEEQSHKNIETKPDLERFKMLFDPSELEAHEPVSFKALYSFDKEAMAEPFEPLIKETGKNRVKHHGEDKQTETIDPGEIVQEAEPEISLEDQAYEQGYAKGFDQGLDQGKEKGMAQGYEQGYTKGEAQGFEKGEPQGFAKGKEDGLDKGYQEGREKAEAEIQKETIEILNPLKDALNVVDPMLDRLIEKYETQIISLIFKISKKAVLASVKLDDGIVRDTILDALKHLVAPEEIILSVSSKDYEYIEMIKDEFFEALESLKYVAVKSDPMINRGGCRIETATATISTDPESKLDAVYEAIINAGLS
jgi:flagellar assembly protein FliH